MEQVFLILGRRDHPTDGVADYCEKLSETGPRQGLSFESVQVTWDKQGWRHALSELQETAAAWRDRWALLQFTTLAWSRRGFPLHAPRVLDALRQCGVHTGVVFHDMAPFACPGVIGRLRESFQMRVLRRLYARADVAIFTTSLKQVFWLPKGHEKATFIPIGANCPESSFGTSSGDHVANTIAVYGVTGGAHIQTEVADISFVVKHASKSLSPIRLIVFGRGSTEAESALRSELRGVNVEVETLGIVAPEQVSRTLANADVLLFVRGPISNRRGSAIAGVACGLPIVCYAGPETEPPITTAGILAVPLGDREALAKAVSDVLSDPRLKSEMSLRSREAHEKYFSWTAITARFASELGARHTVVEPNHRFEADAVARV